MPKAAHKQRRVPRIAKVKKEPRVYTDSPVFFHKGQIRIGTRLLSMGRLDSGSVWVVSRIITFPPGQDAPVPSTVVRRLNDTVHIHKVGYPSAKHNMTFAYLSYSAIWQLAE